MRVKSNILFLFILITSAFHAFAQDAHFSQFYTNNILLNPAFSGVTNCPKATLSYRNQWPGIDKSFRTFYAAYSHYSSSINGGVGGYIYKDVAGENDYANIRVALNYAYHLKIDRKNTVQLAMEAAYFQYSINWQTMTFADMLNIYEGFVYSTNEMIPVGTAKGGVDASFGMVWYGEKVFGGLAIHHLTRPELLVFGENNYLHRKFTFHGGYNINIHTPVEAFVITPSVLFMQQQFSKEFNVGVNIAQEYVNVGLWYRHKDALVFVVGVKMNEFGFSYSYDYTLSSLGVNVSRGAHEVSLSYQFTCPKRKIRHRTFSCPTF